MTYRGRRESVRRGGPDNLAPIRSMLGELGLRSINRTIFHGVYTVIGADGADESLKCT